MDWLDVIGAATSVVAAAIAISLLIPGDEPEKTLKKVHDFLKKISNK